MGELIRAEPVMGNVDLTTEPPVIRPPFEVSSLINRIEGPSVSIIFFNSFKNKNKSLQNMFIIKRFVKELTQVSFSLIRMC
jgi:hypothetical protein